MGIRTPGAAAIAAHYKRLGVFHDTLRCATMGNLSDCQDEPIYFSTTLAGLILRVIVEWGLGGV